jgi:hypothetical protein
MTFFLATSYNIFNVFCGSDNSGMGGFRLFWLVVELELVTMAEINVYN